MSDKTVLEMSDQEIQNTYELFMQKSLHEVHPAEFDDSRGTDGFFKRASILKEGHVAYSIFSNARVGE